MKRLLKKIARRILKDEINERCDRAIQVNHAVIGAHEELLKVLNNKKATKAQMVEAMEKAIALLLEGYARD